MRINYQFAYHLVLLLFLVSVTNVYSNSGSSSQETDDEYVLLKGIERIKYLDSLHNDLVKTDATKRLNNSKEMLKLSIEQNDFYFQHKSYNNIAEAFYQMQEYDSANNYISNAISLYNKSKDDKLLAASYTILSDIYYYIGKHKLGIECANKAIELYGSDDSFKIARLHKEIAVLYREMGDFDNTVNHALISLEYFTTKNDSLYMADAHRIIASVYEQKDLNDLEKIRMNLFRARNLLNNYKSNSLYSLVLGDLGAYYNIKREYDSALYIYYQLHNQYKENNDSLHIANTYISIGNVVGRSPLDSVDRAIFYFKKALYIYKAMNIKKYIAHTEFNIGMANYAIYNYDSALFYLNRSLNIAKEMNYARIYKSSLEYLQLVYEETKDFEKAYQIQGIHHQFVDSTSGEDVKLKVAELETKYETAQKEKQILELEHQNEQEQAQKKMIVFISISALTIVLLIVILLIVRRNKDHQIHKQKEIVHNKEKQLAEIELEKSKLKEEELKQSVIYKSKQLSTHALHMMQKNSMLNDVLLSIKNSSKGSEADKNIIRNIKNQINLSLKSDKDWDVFKLYFEDINRDFYKKLNEINPELTSNDHRLCALIKLNMNSKEMASVLNVAPNSIKSSRYRLKKKLGLDLEAGLEEFIREL